MKFRLLRADEVECRISQVGSWGVQLLLYKDARSDMDILDETFGPMGWQRHHYRENANCVVSIWDPEKKMWIDKEDTGTQSNTEAEKGLASDSFKRACVNWGIGRELYTAPQMFVRASDLKTLKDAGNGRWTCRDSFSVTDIEYDGRKICFVQIVNQKTGGLIEYGKRIQREEQPEPVAAEQEEKPQKVETSGPEERIFDRAFIEAHGAERITEREIERLTKACAESPKGLTLEKALKAARRKSVTSLTYVQYLALMAQLNAAA